VVNSPQKTPVIIAVGDFASGVTSWALRLRDAFANHPRYVIYLLNCTDTRNRIGAFDLQATSTATARDVLARFPEAVVLPNFTWDLFPICAALNASGQRLRCIGFCRADSEEEYYAPLRWYAPMVSQFAAVSPACTAALAHHLGRPTDAIHTLPTGVTVPDSLEREYQCAPIRLAYGGRVVQAQKRVMDFVPLVKALYRREIDFQFDIAGAGQQLDTLKAAIARVDPEGRVRFVPRKKPEAMPDFWAAHDVFVQCSEFEGTSNSMLESMAQGVVPVITETQSGVAGIVATGQEGFLVSVGDMSAAADAIAKLSQDHEKLLAMGAAAHEATRPYSMARYVERFEALLDATMAEPVRTWPEDRPIAPSKPFFGIRLAPDCPGDSGACAKGRIAILFPSPLRGGAEDYTLTIAAGAVEAGYDVQGAFPGKAALKSLIQDYFRVGAFHNTLEICDVGPKSGQAPIYKRFTRTLRILRRLQPQAVLFQLCGMQYGFLSLMACAVLKMPTLVVFQLVRDDLRFSIVRRYFYRWMRSRRQRYVAVSSANRTLLSNAFKMSEEEILVIPNGVDLQRFSSTEVQRQDARAQFRNQLGLPENTILCATVGRLSHQKGHDVLIPAIPHIVARHSNVHFVWAGDGPLEKGLRRQLETYGATDHVTLLGRVDDIPTLLHACDCFVHPARFEGQPFSLIEAMAANLPIVSTAASGIAELITDGEHGILCRPDDIGALRDALLRALDDREAMVARAVAARMRVEAFSESAMITQTLAALESLAEKP